MLTQVISIRQAPFDWQSNPDYVYIGRAGKGCRTVLKNLQKSVKM